MLNVKRLFALAVLVWSGQALGDCIDAGDGRVTCEGAVKTIYSREDGSYSLFLNGTSASNLPCTFPLGNPTGWWNIQSNHPMRREWYSLLLAAAATNANLYVVSKYANTTGGQCEVQRIEWRN